MFTTLITVAKMKHPKCPLAGEWTAWVNLEDLMLGEISQARKDRPCTVLLTKGPRTVKARDAAWWAPGGGGVSVYLDRACLWKMKTSRRMVVMVVHPRACT